MKNTNQKAVQKAGASYLAKMFNHFATIEALGLGITEDDLATDLEAKLLAELEANVPGQAPRSEPPYPPNPPSASGVILPFPQVPSELPLSA